MAKWKATIVDTYVKKTGLDEETLSKLMDDESWFSAEEALAYNFIDEISGEEIKVENYGDMLIANSLSMDISCFKNSPFKSANNKNKGKISANMVKEPPQEPKNIINEEENMTKAELKEKFPDMYNEIYQEGEQAERARIKNIEENAPSGFDELVTKAKFDEPVNYETLAVNILREQQVRDEIIKTENLEIPHPRIQDRLFVLLPLVEIEKDLYHQSFKKSILELLNECKDKSRIRKLNC